MKVHFLQHVPFEGSGSITNWVLKGGHDMVISGLYQKDPLPDLNQFDLLIVLGGPMGVYDEKQYPWLIEEKRLIESAIRADKTVLGICLGAQLIATVLGKKVVRNPEREIGWHPLKLAPVAQRTPLFNFIPDDLMAFHWHSETFEIPDKAQVLAGSEACPNQAFQYGQRVLGLQFHLEATPEAAQALIKNCADEIVPGCYIQKPQEILASPWRFDIINGYMFEMLNRMASIS